MILRTLRVENWRCFVEAVELGPFGEGLNVVHGPNAVGKSTLMWALTRALFDGHRVSGKDIESLRPYQRELQPRVTVQFDHQGVAYQICKQFLGGHKSELSRLEGGRFVRLAEGASADELTRKMLAGDAAARGVTEPKHWGFAQVLWATQGELRIRELSDGTRNTIREALGAQVVGLDTGRIEERIRDSYDSIFTQGGRLKSGQAAPRVVELERSLDQANQRKLELTAQLAAFDQASRRIEDLRHEVEEKSKEEQEHDRACKAVGERVGVFLELLNKKQTSAQAAELAKRDYDLARTAIESIQGVRKSLDEARGTLAEIKSNLEFLEKELARNQSVEHEAKRALEAARELERRALSGKNLALDAERLINARATCRERKRQIESHDGVIRELTELRTARGNVVAPDANALREIKKLNSELQQLHVQLDASLITLTIVAESDASFEVLAADSETGPRRLLAGDSARIKGAPEVAIRAPGWGTVRASGPQGSTAQLRASIDEKRSRLDTLTAGFRGMTIEELEDARDKAKGLDDRIVVLGAKADELLGGCRREDLIEEAVRAEQIVEEVLSRHALWKDVVPDPRAILASVDESVRNASAAVADAGRAHALAEQQVRAHEQQRSRHEAKLSAADARVEMLAAQLANLTANGGTDEDREAARGSHALAWDAAKANLAAADADLAKLGVDPRPEWKQLDGQLKSLRASTDEAKLKLNTAQSQLAAAVASAPYSKLAEVEEEIAALLAAVARERLSNNAIRLLYETLRKRQQEISESVHGPVRRLAAQTMQRIMGPQFNHIEFGKSFEPVGVSPRPGDASLAVDYLSGGEQEQVHFAVRLALADIAFGKERQLVVLDDAFTATDRARLARIVGILEETAERFQIVLLSCHPERYRHLPNAKLFDLEEIKRQSQNPT